MTWNTKRVKWIVSSNRSARLLVGSCSAFLLAVLCVGCKPRSSSYEVTHIASPNGNLEAVLTETNGGATSSFGYEVGIGPKGGKTEKVATLYGAVRNAQAYGVNLSWADNSVLRVQYLRAKAVQNVVKTLSLDGHQVEVQLQSGVEDPTAPSGGMQYNLTKQAH